MVTSPRQRPYQVLDVFGTGPCTGNPLAVVVDGTDLTTEQMQAYASWTNLSETTFLLPPTTDEADYRVRIFTPGNEMSFAGHPTLGSCRAWLNAGSHPTQPGRVVQECEAGLVTLEVGEKTQAFRAPELRRSGPVDEATLAAAIDTVGLDRSAVVEAEWVDNGPGWLGILVDNIERLHSLSPAIANDNLGFVALYPDSQADADGASPSEGGQASGPRYDVRAFFEANGVTLEDPATGSLQASVAQWMLRSGRVVAPFQATQGQVMGRGCQVAIRQDDEGAVWVAGEAVAQITGTVLL